VMRASVRTCEREEAPLAHGNLAPGSPRGERTG
jgi:hypothetical protein